MFNFLKKLEQKKIFRRKLISNTLFLLPVKQNPFQNNKQCDFPRGLHQQPKKYIFNIILSSSGIAKCNY